MKSLVESLRFVAEYVKELAIPPFPCSRCKVCGKPWLGHTGEQKQQCHDLYWNTAEYQLDLLARRGPFSNGHFTYDQGEREMQELRELHHK